ncbi:MAG: type IV pilus assembly protein PilC [Oleiphilaceae bacterium]
MKKKNQSQDDIIQLVRHIEHLILNGLSLDESLAKLDASKVASTAQLQLVRALLKNKDDESKADPIYADNGLSEISSLIATLYQHKCSPEQAVPALSHSLSIDQNYMSQIWKGLQSLASYVISVVVVICICLSIFSTKVIPQFEDMFNGFGAQLPAFTEFVVQGTNAIGDIWPIIILIGAALYMVSKKRISRRGGLKPMHRFWSQIPFTKNLYRTHFRYLLICFTHILIKGGLDSKVALESSLRLLGSKITDIEQTSASKNLPEILKETAELKSIADAYQIDTVPREIEFQLARIEQDYLLVIANLRERLSSIIQILLGLMVGGIIIAMYLPIFSMGSAM